MYCRVYWTLHIRSPFYRKLQFFVAVLVLCSSANMYLTVVVAIASISTIVLLQPRRVVVLHTSAMDVITNFSRSVCMNIQHVRIALNYATYRSVLFPFIDIIDVLLVFFGRFPQLFRTWHPTRPRCQIVYLHTRVGVSTTTVPFSKHKPTARLVALHTVMCGVGEKRIAAALYLSITSLLQVSPRDYRPTYPSPILCASLLLPTSFHPLFSACSVQTQYKTWGANVGLYDFISTSWGGIRYSKQGGCNANIVTRRS